MNNKAQLACVGAKLDKHSSSVPQLERETATHTAILRAQFYLFQGFFGVQGHVSDFPKRRSGFEGRPSHRAGLGVHLCPGHGQAVLHNTKKKTR